MKKRTNKRVALLLPFALLASFAFAGLPGSAAAQSNTANKVVDFETMTGTLNSDGSLNTNTLSLLDDLRVTGSGDVTVVDPNSTTDLRNLMGYSGPTADGTNQVKYTINNLNGTKQFLTTSNPVGKAPPVALGIAYTLNGQSVAAGSDLVGKSGEVGISFTVKNTTSKTEIVRYKDSEGHTLSSPQPVALPLVANLQVTLPPNVFTQVDAPGSDIVTDGFGNKIVNWGLVLVPPVGDVTQTVTLNAHADNFSLGQVQLAASPVAPESRQYLAYTQDQFQNAIQQSGSLYSGTLGLANQLDQVNAGALKIIGGLEKLYKGQLKLANGLASAIAPSGQLMGGIGKLKGGLQSIADGVVANGPKLKAGIAKLDAGLATIQACLAGEGNACINPADHSHNPSIVGVADLTEAGLNVCLQSGLQQNCQLKTSAAGKNVDPFPYLAGSIRYGPPYFGAQPGGVYNCLAPKGTATPCYGGPSIYDVAQTVGTTCGAPCSSDMTTLLSQITVLKNKMLDIASGMDETAQAMITAFVTGTSKKPAALDGIKKIANGASAGIGTNSPSAVAACSKNSANCTVRSGLGLLLQQLVGGFGSESPAAVQECLADSAKCTLLSGVGALINGLGQLQTGLQTGLGQAASGAQIIATCIGAAGNQCKPPGATTANPSVKGGMEQLQQGVYAINELGVKEVARQANDTQGNIGAQLAVMQAENKRAQDDSLLYGPPSSDQAQTVVGGSSVVLTMNALDNRKNQTVSRGVMAGIALLLLFGLGMLGIRGMRRSAA